MEILFVLIPVSIIVCAFAIGVFLWAVNNGQFDDLDTPAWTVLRDDARQAKPTEETAQR